MSYAFTWWLVIEILGLVALPVTLTWLRSLPDRGYVFSKAIGLLLVSYGLWLVASFRILPNERGSVILLLLALGVTSLLVLARHRQDVGDFVRRRWRLILGTEVLFLFAFLLWALVRAYNPAIEGTEKPMDFAFVNAILRSEYFPPHDPWLSGHSISYYYFGHLMVAVLLHLSGVPSAVGFNLAVALLFALTAAGAFSLGYTLVAGNGEAGKGGSTEDREGRRTGARGSIERRTRLLSLASSVFRSSLLPALLASLFLVGVSNLQGGLEIARANGVGTASTWRWIGVNGALEPYQSSTWYPDEPGWWWWRATRVINTLTYSTSPTGQLQVNDRADYTISEFPFFSFLLGDLHPHVMALPFALLALALALNTLRSQERYDRAWLRAQAPWVALSALALGGLGFLNSWDFPAYTAIFLGSAGLAVYARRQALDRGWLREVAWLGAVTAGGGIALFLPFYVGFRSQASGILPVTGPGTRPIHYLIVWGLFLFVLLSFMALLAAQLRAPEGHASGWRSWLKQTGWWVMALPLAPVVVWLLADAAYILWLGGTGLLLSQMLARVWMLPPLVALVALALLLLDRRVRSRHGREATSDKGSSRAGRLGDTLSPRPGSVVFALLLAAVGLTLTLGCELFFIRDVFGNRMNTVFKLYYQAWVMLAIASAYAVYYVHSRISALPAWRQLRLVWWMAFAVLIVGSVVYPVSATYAKANRFAGKPTLDGLDFVQMGVPAEYEAVQWLNSRVAGSPVVVEATGPQYSEYGRVAARTGLPTLLGWAGHESQWRGTDAPYRGRDADIDQIYQSLDRTQVASILRKYGVTYVYVGSLERLKYGPTVDARLAGFMDVAYRNQGVVIFKVRQ